MDRILKAGIKIVPDEPMSKHTTFRIGGPAEWYAEAVSVSQLILLMQYAQEKKIPIFFWGAGSNLLVSDHGIAGLVIHLCGEFETVTYNDDHVRAGSAVHLPTLVKMSAEKGLGGIEPLVGIPGTLGGALIMNAGTRELQIGQVVKSVEVIQPNGLFEVLTADQIQFQYRSSSLNGKTICFATLKLKPGNKDDIMRTVQNFLSHRLQTQPIGTLNAGSVFKNPEGHYAAQLIESAGLKGLKIGNAQVSTKHANFIVNLGGATAEDIKKLILEIQKKVHEKTGVRLEPEIKIVGR